jgi:hypothetical protein
MSLAPLLALYVLSLKVIKMAKKLITGKISAAAKQRGYNKAQPLWFTMPPYIKVIGPLSAHFEPKSQPRTKFHK